MKKIIVLLLLLSGFLISNIYGQAQNKMPLTADSLATGNYKDVLSSFFQLSFDKLTGPNKELRFTSNPYAVLARLDTNLLVDTNYYNYRNLRKLNFSFALKLDSSYKFNGFSSGINYAIINRRDETVSRTFLNMVAHDSVTKEVFSLASDIEAYISVLNFSDSIMGKKIRAQQTAFRRGELNFDKLDPAFQDSIEFFAKRKNAIHLLRLIKTEPAFNLQKTSSQIYNDIKSYFNNRFLWTVGISDTTYKNKFMFSNVVLTTEMLKGIDSMKSADIELNFKAACQFTDDTLKGGRDLKRSVLRVEPGVNFVLKNKLTLKSWFEFKLSGGFYHTFTSLYKDEERTRVTLNGLMRVRVFKDIWVPLEIKYDPKSGNILGFLNVRANFTALGNLIKGS